MRELEYPPMIIPVICHVYCIDKEYDLMDRSTILFDQVAYHITRLSHGLVNYQSDSFIRNETLLNPNYIGKYDFFEYLSWSGQSIRKRIEAGFTGEFWILTGDNIFPVGYSVRNIIRVMGLNLNDPVERSLESFYFRMQENKKALWRVMTYPKLEKYFAKISDKTWYEMVIK